MIFQRNYIKTWLKSLLALVLVAFLVLGNASDAAAARTGGRIGGGSFRAPSRSYSAPRSGSYGRGYSSGYGRGGFGFPFLIPFFGFGGGGLFSILLFLALAGYLVRSLQHAGGSLNPASGASPTAAVAVAKVQVGLLANARELQPELNRLALAADTKSAEGRADVLQEAALALLRHPEYWVYGATESQQAGFDAAGAKFNQLALTERSKFTEETLSNVNNVVSDDSQQALGSEGDAASLQLKTEGSGEYIVATVIVGARGNLKLPQINGSEDLRQALQQVGSLDSERLLAVEILWTPQADGDTLSTDDILAYYPNLKLV